MKPLLLMISSLVLGAAVGVACTLYLVFGWPPETVVFTTNERIAAGEIEIPGGTELVLHRYMPEGFATLRLYLNVEGEAWSKFSTRAEPVFDLVIPYSVDAGS